MKLKIIDIGDGCSWFAINGYNWGDIVTPVSVNESYYFLEGPVNGRGGFMKSRFVVVPEFELPKELFEI